MKRLFLVVSLLANAALLCWIAATALAFNARERSVPQIQSQPKPIIQEPIIDTATNRIVVPPPPFRWSQVESTNYAIYVENLRSIGCPEIVIRRIITGDLDDLYTQRRQKILEPWQSQLWDLASEAVRSPLKWIEKMKPVGEELQKTMRGLDKEKAEVVKSLLGDKPAAPPASGENSFTPPQYLSDYLTEEKQKQVLEIEKKFNQMTAEVRKKIRGKPESEIAAQLEQIKGQRQQEIQAMLSPAEYEEYRLRSSSAASIRWQTYGFDASADEWRNLAKAKMELEEQYSVNAIADAKAKNDARKQMQSQLDDQYKNILGPERYADFERSQQSDYQSILRVTERCELPAQTAVEAYNIKRSAESAAKQLMENKNLTQQQLSNAMESVRIETERALSQAMGERAFKTYSRYSGQWLNKFK